MEMVCPPPELLHDLRTFLHEGLQQQCEFHFARLRQDILSELKVLRQEFQWSREQLILLDDRLTKCGDRSDPIPKPPKEASFAGRYPQSQQISGRDAVPTRTTLGVVSASVPGCCSDDDEAVPEERMHVDCSDSGRTSLLPRPPKPPKKEYVSQCALNPNERKTLVWAIESDSDIEEVVKEVTRASNGRSRVESPRSPGSSSPTSPPDMKCLVAFDGSNDDFRESVSQTLSKMPSSAITSNQRSKGFRKSTTWLNEVEEAAQERAQQWTLLVWVKMACRGLARLLSLDVLYGCCSWLGGLDLRNFSVKRVIQSAEFDYAIGIGILLNSVVIGVETDASARDLRGEEPRYVAVFEYLFAVIFAGELVARLWVYKIKFFYQSNWKWNLFDLVVVILQIADMVSSALAMNTANFSFMRVVRVFRLLRVLRLARILHLVTELRTIVMSISASMRSLGWTIVLIVVMIYIIAVFFTQIVTDKRSDVDISPELEEKLVFYYGSLSISFFSLYGCIMGGIDWADPVRPLIQEISPLYGIIFCLYIAFSLLALMNVVTGVFVETAMQGSEEEQDDLAVSTVMEILAKAVQTDIDENGAPPSSRFSFTSNMAALKDLRLTYGAFVALFKRPDLHNGFKGALDIDANEADQMFRLLDIEDKGYVDCEEFARACLKIKKPARAIDLEIVMYESRKKFLEAGVVMERQLDEILKVQDLVRNFQDRMGSEQTPKTPRSTKSIHSNSVWNRTRSSDRD